MSFHEQFDPTIDLLRGLPQVAPQSEATARVRRSCHAAMARRAPRQARDSRSRRWRGLSEAVWILPLGLYLLASVIETVRVVISL
jgi:hypothetical protein